MKMISNSNKSSVQVLPSFPIGKIDDLSRRVKTLEDAVPGGSGTITTQDEGGTLSGTVTTLNFTGAGVTASGAGATTTINIPGGAGSFAVTETELDFGTKPVADAIFTVTDVAITGTSKIMCTESGNTATGRAAGDAQWDSVAYSALAGTGSFTVYARPSGAIVGKRKMFYTYS